MQHLSNEIFTITNEGEYNTYTKPKYDLPLQILS